MQTVDLTKPATQEAIASIIGASRQTVSTVELSGVCTREMPLGDWLRAYISQLRETAAGRLGSGGLDLVTERARLAKEQADRVAMQNAISRKEFAPVSLIEEVLTDTASKVAGILEGIPGMIRRRLPHMTADEIDLITAEIVKARNMVAGMSLEDVRDDAAASDEADAPDGDVDESGGD